MGTLRAMDLLREAMCLACLRDLPLLEMREDNGEIATFERFVRRHSRAELAARCRRERRTGTPLGPNGMWAWRAKKHGRLVRPHRLEEVCVETMYFGLDAGRRAIYTIVLSSGRFGAFETVYVGGELVFQVDARQTEEQATNWRRDLAARDLALDGKIAVGRYGAFPNVSLGNA